MLLLLRLLLLLLLRLNLVEVGRQPMLAIRVVCLALRLLSLVASKRRLRLLGVGRDRGGGARREGCLAGKRGLCEGRRKS